MRSTVALACLLVALPGVAESQSVQAPRLHVLENGLRVLTVEDPSSPIVTTTWSAHVGDSAEPLDFAGNSHYLEHLLLFRGTEKHPKNAIGEWIAGRGGYFNGHTWYDYTTFEITLSSTDLDAALERHEEMMFHGAFSGTDFETEKEAVIEELRTAFDRPYGYLWRAAPYQMYDGDTFYSRSTIGTEETVRAATVERVRRYYKDYYVPNNMTMALVGDIDTDEALAKVEERFGGYPSGSAPPPLYAPMPIKPGVTVVSEERDVGKAYFLLATHGPQASSPEYFPYVLLSAYLSHGKTSRFQDELVARRKVLDDISVSAMARRFPKGWQAIEGEGDPATLSEAVGGIWQLLAQVAAGAVSEEEIDLARRRLIAAHRIALDDQLQVATALVEADAHGDYRLFSEYEERLARVSVADVCAVAKKYMTPDHFFLMALFPPAEAPADFEQTIITEAARYVRQDRGAVARRLDSGATLIHEPRPGAAIESMTVAVHAGHRDGDTAGIADAVATMMTRRTASRSKQELQDHLDRSGFRLNSWTSRDAAFFSLESPAGSTSEALALLIEVLTEPGFTNEEWDATQTEMLAALDFRLDQPRSVAYDALISNVFSETRYGDSIAQQQEGIAGLTTADLTAFWRQQYRAGSLAVAYSGGAPADQLAAGLAGLAAIAGAAPPRQPIQAAALSGVQRTARPMEGKTQANLYLAWPAPPLNSDDWIRWELARRAIGGDLAGRLWRLRQDEGLAYSVWLSASNLADQPLTHIYMATAADKREQALAALDREVRRAVAGLSAEELARVKVSYLADLNRRDRTAARRSQRMAEWWSQGLAVDRRQRLKQVIAQTTLAEVNRVSGDVLAAEAYFFAEAGAVPE